LRRLKRWLNSTSRRTFFVIPALVILVELVLGAGRVSFVPWGIPLLIWGYVQCRLSASYRTRLGGGGPGRDVPPDRIVRTGIYGYIRNPMYLGNMIFLAGLAVTLWSSVALVILAGHVVWYERRVREDEVHLTRLFGDAYTTYLTCTKRWIPFVY
jgi:protein-S-isoprenylcysteine O-methyltransferase Ste14